MKKILLCVILLCGAAGVLPAQSPADSVRIEAYIPVHRGDPVNWITRYQKDIDKYTDRNRTLSSRECDVLFLGSSSVNLWDDIYTDMAPLKVIRRSYGGATIRDMIYNYDVIARGYRPGCIAIYVANDLAGGATDVSVGEAYDLIRVFAGMIRRDYPGTRFYIISYLPSLSRAMMLDKQTMLNTLLCEYAASTPGIGFIDVTPGMYDAGGRLKTDIFKPDGLHLNRAGYDIWTAAIKPVLLKACE